MVVSIRSGLYKILNVRDSTLTLLDIGIKNSMKISRAYKAAGIHENNSFNGDTRPTKKVTPMLQ